MNKKEINKLARKVVSTALESKLYTMVDYNNNHKLDRNYMMFMIDKNTLEFIDYRTFNNTIDICDFLNELNACINNDNVNNIDDLTKIAVKQNEFQMLTINDINIYILGL